MTFQVINLQFHLIFNCFRLKITHYWAKTATKFDIFHSMRRNFLAHQQQGILNFDWQPVKCTGVIRIVCFVLLFFTGFKLVICHSLLYLFLANNTGAWQVSKLDIAQMSVHPFKGPTDGSWFGHIPNIAILHFCQCPLDCTGCQQQTETQMLLLKYPQAQATKLLLNPNQADGRIALFHIFLLCQPKYLMHCFVNIKR